MLKHINMIYIIYIYIYHIQDRYNIKYLTLVQLRPTEVGLN